MREKRSMTGLVAVLTALTMIVAAGALSGADARRGVAYAEGDATSDDLASPFKAVYEAVSPSVVGVEVTYSANIFSGRFGEVTAFAGSGVVINEEGYVLTNYHVVSGARGLFVSTGGESIPATYVAGDQDSDIAVLRAQGLTLPPAVLGDSDALSVGDWALVIGNPLGDAFVSTLSVGVVSGLERDVTALGRSVNRGATAMLQTDAAINAGNSGGGLFNIRGELVGITSMKLSSGGGYGVASVEGIGLAIPINGVKLILNDLIAYGRVLHPRIGITMREIHSSAMEPTRDSLPASVWVYAVEEDSPAEKAGIRKDDLILEMDGERVTTPEQAQSIVRGHKAGETVSVRVYRIPNLTGILVDEPIPEGEYFTFEVPVMILDAD